MKVFNKITLCVFLWGSIFCFLSSCKAYYNAFYTDPDKCFKEAQLREPVDAIIVPGYPHQKEGWSEVVKGRVYWAVYLYEKGLAKNIIFSGSAVYSPYVECEIMALYAAKLGIPRENIYVETKAEHSTENLYYSWQLAKNKGFKTVSLATDPAQSSFLKSFKRKFKMDVGFIPILYDTLKTIPKSDPIVDQEKAFVNNFVPITEREGLFKRLRGTRGHVIKKLIKQNKKQSRKK
jgi:uncharacterized SAM-binding protein YcdF (DUF218 family)